MNTTKKLITTLASVLALLASANGARALGEAEVFDSCMAHDWSRFAAAVESNDIATLEQMAREPELRGCGAIVATARLLACAADPMPCIEPAAGPDPKTDIPPPPVIEIDCPTWNPRCTELLPPPGAHIGIERDGPDGGGDGGGNGGGGSGGGSAAAAPSPAPAAGRI